MLQRILIPGLRDRIQKMKRIWPFAFLIAFVLILSFHTAPSSQRILRSRIRIAVEDAAPPDIGEPIARRSPPSSRSTIEPEEAPKPEARSPVLAGLLWALRQQNPDGSWGDGPTTLGGRTIGNTGVTSLVLLSLLGAGYSHLSRDEFDGIAIGPQVKKALEWLTSQQREDGRFHSGFDDPFDQALAALALGETYGMTASQSLKAPAALSLDALVRLQGADGSWGGSTPTFWAVQALVSGELSELPYPKETRERALAYLRTQASPGSLEARQLLKDRSDPDAMESMAQSIVSSLPFPGEPDVESLSHQSFGLFLYDGADGVLWKQWSGDAGKALHASQNGDGSWNGGTLSHRLARTSMAEFSLQIYYRYANIRPFGR
jgi:hypothetical protein